MRPVQTPVDSDIIASFSQSKPEHSERREPRVAINFTTENNNGSDDNILGGKTRTEFKEQCYKNIISCETGTALLVPVDRNACDVQRLETLGGKHQRGIVDFVEVGNLIKTLCCPQCNKNIDTKEARGLAVDGQVYCATCQEPVAERFLASRGDGRHSKSFVVNRQAVYSSLVLLTTEVRPVQTPVDSDIIARSAGQPPIQKLNALNCYARGQLRMQRNQTLPTPVQPDALKQQLHGYREDLSITLINGFTFGF